jgi:signal peptide peptidase SppA
MRYDRLFTKLYCEPLLLKVGAWRGFERALLNHAANFAATGDKLPMRASAGALGFSRADSVTPDQTPDQDWLRHNKIVEATQQQMRLDNVYRKQGDVAVIKIDGVIDKHISRFDMDCYGGYDIADLDRALALAAADPDIRNVMLEIRSPGGSVTGVPESAAKVAQLARTKNVFAFTDGMCCSAAYYIASQADQIFGTASSDVGSIGVYCALLDISKQLEAEGVAVNFIKDGKFKGMGAPFKPLTDEERQLFQDEVEKIGSMFRAAVTSKRPQVSIDTMQGQSFFGDSALDVGLVDAIVPDLSSALAQF